MILQYNTDENQFDQVMERKQDEWLKASQNVSQHVEAILGHRYASGDPPTIFTQEDINSAFVYQLFGINPEIRHNPQTIGILNALSRGFHTPQIGRRGMIIGNTAEWKNAGYTSDKIFYFVGYGDFPGSYDALESSHDNSLKDYINILVIGKRGNELYLPDDYKLREKEIKEGIETGEIRGYSGNFLGYLLEHTQKKTTNIVDTQIQVRGQQPQLIS